MMQESQIDGRRPQRTASPRVRRTVLCRLLLPALLPLLWHPAARAQWFGSGLPDTGAGIGSAAAGTVPGVAVGGGGSTGTAVGPGLLAAATGRSWRLVPRIMVSETLTDNVRLSSSDRRADLITRLTVGAQLTSTAGRLRGFADYSLTGVFYASGSSSTTLQNTLSAVLTAELLEKRAFVDFNANVSQQSLSVFGTQSSDPALANANRTEVRTYRISPFLRGAIADLASYELRLTRTGSHTSASSIAGVTTTTASVLLNGSGGRLLNWSADALRQRVDNASGVYRESDRINGVLLYNPVPELRISLIGGREANNYLTVDKTSSPTYGLRLNWIPGPRTNVVAERQHRFFGNSHVLSLSHRMARSSVLASDVRDVVISGTQGDGGVRTTLFDLYNLQFIRIEPDAILRRALVNNFLRANGLDPNTLLPFNVLTSAISVQRLQQLSMSWFGQRDTLTLLASRTATDRISDLVTSNAGALSNYSSIRQQSVAATLVHRLTPQSNLTGTLLQQRNVGDSNLAAAVQSTRLRSATLSVSTRINLLTAASLSMRHQRFESTADSYRESALTANLNLQF